MPYVLDCIARCAFGVEADCQTDPNHPFVKHSKAVQDDIIKRPGFILAGKWAISSFMLHNRISLSSMHTFYTVHSFIP